ncbi:fatty acid desaturase [Paraburkholderia sp. Tr-20389]|uniref:fatty acid desaturase n=1 Tax=Paraburkholderia sp. Tr-20389 TaxID=2703903 RepID=UPI00197D1328|nr:fatty acid desaturase [Paraburkholderia sp. Tr-20389]MBN3757368.1 fatty acid desaturase [Paraburkholderia sp. Tr-20389]
MSFYLDDAQRQTLARRRKSFTWCTEWPTWLLIGTIYGGWFFVASHARVLGLSVAIALLAVFSAWYMSLQHELLHGHPTRFAFVNGLIGFAPLAVWFPYRVYRDLHLQHHDDPHLTHPEIDPESYFVSSDAWRQAGPLTRALLVARNTFFGRLLLGPAFSIAATATQALRKPLRGDWSDVPAWLAHFAALAVLMVWLDRVCGIAPWLFIAGVGYPALALSAVRSFHEHRAAGSHEQRSVINEAAWFWRLLFLNNNYHLVHHDLPHVPWFAIRRVYEASRQQYAKRSGGFLVKGYSEWLTRYGLTVVAHPVAGSRSARCQENPPASIGSAGKLQVKFMVVVRDGACHEAYLSGSAERETTSQAL